MSHEPDEDDDAYLLKYATLLKPKRSEVDESMDEPLPDDVSYWAGVDASHSAIRDVLMSLSVTYSEDDFSNAEKVQATLEVQQRLKQQIDASFHKEMHHYHKGSIGVVPGMLDLCDALDDSVDDSRETAQLLDRCRLAVSNSVRLISLRRRRDNLRKLSDSITQVTAWQLKLETIISKLQSRDFRSAIIMLGARMYSDTGSPKLLKEASKPTQQQQPAASPTTKEDATDSTPPKKMGRQRATTIAYMQHSHAARPSIITLESSRAQSPGREADSQHNHAQDELNDFIDGVGGVCAATVVGRVSLAAFYQLKENGTELVVHALKSEIHSLLTQTFSPGKLFRVVDGLFALKVRGDSISRFVLDCIAPVISDTMLTALTNVVGDDAGTTWEAVSDTLVPSEFHDCTVSVLAKLATLLRSVLELQTFCTAVVRQEESVNPESFESLPTELTERREICLTSCRFLSTIGLQTLNKCLASIILYAIQTKVSRGQLEDSLHVYYLLHRFVDMANNVSTDGAATSAKASLRYQCSRVVREEYLGGFMEALISVMQSDLFLPWAATPEDFPPLYPFVHEGSHVDDSVLFKEYLLPAKPTGLKPLIEVLAPGAEGELASSSLMTGEGTVAVNPFLVSTSMDSTFVPITPIDTSPLQLFDAVPLFTFTSSMVCKRMLEVARTVVYLDDAASVLLDCVTYLASIYVWFVLTHFVASTETVGLDQDANVPNNVRDFARTIREWTTFLPPPNGFPIFSNAPCHMWKQRASMPQTLHAAQERTTAICSLESVVVCHRLVVCALTPLLPADSMVPVANVSEALSGVAKYATTQGLRRVALNIIPPETIASLIEKANHSIQANQATVDGLSTAFRTITDQLHSVHLRLRECHRDMPFVGAQKLLEQLVFIVCCGVVEGVSRVRKLSDAGRQQLLRDATGLSRLLQTLHPSIPLRLFDYVVAYVRAFCASFQEAIPFIQTSHGWYTARQLIALGDKDGFLKKREAEQLLSKLSHEDRLPLHLLES